MEKKTKLRIRPGGWAVLLLALLCALLCGCQSAAEPEAPDAQEQAAQDDGHPIDYEAVMAPDLACFCQAAGLPAAPNALSDAGYMFTLSGADLIRDVYAYCGDLAERMGSAGEVKPGYAIKLALRLFLLDSTAGSSTADNNISA